MSGIAGFMNLDGRPADGLRIEAMCGTLEHRGPDGAGAWHDGTVALGHRLLHTTPESLYEALPRSIAEDRFVLTCDARIDNRDDLIRRLKHQGDAGTVITDSELILHAYATWGTRCPEHLLGDFAFAIWDRGEQRLFCARDCYGTKPFFFHHDARRLFAFASEIKALLALEEVPTELDREHVTRYVRWNWGGGEGTFYSGIRRLRAAHALSVTAEGLKAWRYWSPLNATDVRFRTSAEYEEAFRDVFFEAVRCRLRSAFPVGSMLSGGIDSSSVATSAAQLLGQDGAGPLHTYSLVFDAAADCDERPYINAVLARGGFEPHMVLGDDVSPLEDFERVMWHLDEPPHLCLYALPWAKFRAAGGDGVRVLLDGLMGDEVLGNYVSQWHLTSLAQQGRLLQLAATTLRYARNTGRSPLLVLRKEVARNLASPAVADAWRRLRRRPAHENNLSGVSGSFLGGPSATGSRGPGGPAPRRTVRERHANAADPRSYHGPLALANPLAAAHGVEVRYPFVDRRVVEFCVGMPTEQKFLGGWPRSIIRRALAGVLPDEIRWRTDKGHLTTWYTDGIAAIEPERFERMAFAGDSDAADLIDLDRLRSVWETYRTGRDSVLASAIWIPFAVAAWRQAAAAAPAASAAGQA